MYISINWLKIILNLNHVKLNFLKEKLTLCGFEIETIQIPTILNKSDIILDLTTTTNRPDILSIIGLTEEIKNLFYLYLNNLKKKNKTLNYFNNSNQKKINFTNKFSFTSLFITSEFKNINIKTIQPWIKRRLLSSNIVPQNNINDLAKYVMLEWGQPIYLYDYDKLKSLTNQNKPEFSVRFAKLDELFIDLNLNQYFLTEKTLVVTANNIPISIAGSIISNQCFIDNNTKNILIQVSIFDSNIFRNSEKSVGLRTEASIFYERGINPFLVKGAYNRFLQLIFLSNDNKNLDNFNLDFIYHTSFISVNKQINLSLDNIKKILGINNNTLIIKTINDFLIQSNFKFFYHKTHWSIFVPFTRLTDLEEEIDLIEEFSRFYEFNNFSAVLPFSKKFGKLSTYEILKREFRDNFIKLGFSEIYNYSLTAEKFNVPNIINPLNNDYSALRNNFFPQLLKIFERNISNKNKISPIFEISRSFQKNHLNNYFEETEKIYAIFSKQNYRISWLSKEAVINWFQVKYILETIFNNLDLKINFSKKYSPSFYYHRNNCLNIFYENEQIGVFGEIHPKLSKINKLLKNCFLIELEFTKILTLKTNQTPIYYQSYSYYPCLSIDLSLLIPIEINFQQIILVIKECGKDLLESIELFDVYEKFDSIPKDYSLGLELIFRSKNKTLVKSEIDLILLEIENKLKQNFAINIRI